MDKLFPEPALDDRFALIVQIMTDTIAEHGYTEMRNVPGDQHAAQRARAAAEAINDVLTGEPTPMPTPWRLSWDTWATS